MTSRAPTLLDVLAAMDDDQFHFALLRLMTYPRTQKLNKTDKPILTARYSCTDSETCDFREALDAIRSSTTLRAYGSQDIVKKIVQDISKFPQDHMAANLDGFQIYRCGKDLLRLQRVDDKKQDCCDDRTAYVEYNDIRVDLLNQLQIARMQFFHDIAVKVGEKPFKAKVWKWFGF